MSFIFGGRTGLSPAEAQRLRDRASRSRQAMQGAYYRRPADLIDPLGNLAASLIDDYRAKRGEERGREASEAWRGEMIAALLGEPDAAAAAPPPAMGAPAPGGPVAAPPSPAGGMPPAVAPMPPVDPARNAMVGSPAAPDVFQGMNAPRMPSAEQNAMPPGMPAANEISAEPSRWRRDAAAFAPAVGPIGAVAASLMGEAPQTGIGDALSGFADPFAPPKMQGAGAPQMATNAPGVPSPNLRGGSALDPSLTGAWNPPQLPAPAPATDPAVEMLTRVMLGEAAGEGPDGMRAVGHVVLNRMADPRWPGDIAGVVQQPRQFSAFNTDGSGNDLVNMSPDDPRYQQAQAIAEALLAGEGADPTGGATHYFSPAGMRALTESGYQQNSLPSWYAQQAQAGAPREIGGHVFLGQAQGAPSAPAAAPAPSMQAAQPDPRRAVIEALMSAPPGAFEYMTEPERMVMSALMQEQLAPPQQRRLGEYNGLLYDQATGEPVRDLSALRPGQASERQPLGEYDGILYDRFSGAPVRDLGELRPDQPGGGAGAAKLGAAQQRAQLLLDQIEPNFQRLVGLLGVEGMAPSEEFTAPGEGWASWTGDNLRDNLITRLVGADRLLKRDDVLQVEQLTKAIIQDAIFMKSGAAATETEVERMFDIYGIQASDPVEVRAQKMKGLVDLVEGARRYVGQPTAADRSIDDLEADIYGRSTP